MVELPYATFFIVGSPRSGKTLLQNILGFHEDLAWLSQFNSRFSSWPLVGILNAVYDLPWIGNVLLPFSGSRYLPHPEEISKKYAPIMQRYGSLSGVDVTETDQRTLRAVFEHQLRYQRKRKIIADCGRPARLLYFNAIFPGTRFIHVVRDGRDVSIESVAKYPYMFSEEKALEDFFPNAPNELREAVAQYKWQAVYRIVLAALHWKMSILEIEQQALRLGDAVHVVRYEDFTRSPDKILREILDFLGLGTSDRITRLLERKRVHYFDKGTRTLNPSERALVRDLLEDELIQYHYL